MWPLYNSFGVCFMQIGSVVAEIHALLCTIDRYAQAFCALVELSRKVTDTTRKDQSVFQAIAIPFPVRSVKISDRHMISVRNH